MGLPNFECPLVTQARVEIHTSTLQGLERHTRNLLKLYKEILLRKKDLGEFNFWDKMKLKITERILKR